MEKQQNVRKKLQTSTASFCNIHDNPSCLIRSRTNSGNSCCDTSLTALSPSYHLRNWELDPST
uniref:Ovule protein n=1 Tax=Loa loa TaxID=7209 RepID=A0A1I7V7Y2_LOALO